MPTIHSTASAVLLLLATCLLGEAVMAAETPTWNEEAAYTDGDGNRVGGRYVHAATGLPIRILRIESVPQVFMHFHTPPVSDRGEPHTQEHLLLGKGSVGKAAAAKEAMSLVGSTAYTAQTDTCYSFHCDAGKDTFFDVLETHLHAMLFPDYTDEEIRREVWHVGVVRDADGTLSLEERGTIYNEMVTTYEKRWNVFYEIGDLLYGDGHPYSYSAGGEPTAIRAMTPEHIHDFHRSTYHLSPNMGLIVSLPPSIPTAEFLERFGKTVDELAATPGHAERPRTKLPIPPVQPSDDRTPLLIPYPNTNEEDTGSAVFCWPPTEPKSVRETMLRQLFLEALAGGETSVLHGVLLDPERRQVEVEATAVWGGLEEEKTTEVAMLGLSNYGDASEEELSQLATRMSEEAARIAGLEGGSDELASFNRRVETRLLELERELKRRVSQPPRFGYRRSGGFWLSHLRLVDREGGEARKLTLDDEIAAIREQLIGNANPWAQVVSDLGMSGTPYSAASFPSAAEVTRRANEREELLERTTGELAAATDGAEPLAALQSKLEAATASLEARDDAIPPAHLVDDIPLTLDDALVWEVGELEGTPTFRAHFETMSAVEVNLVFDIAHVSRDELKLLPLLPSLVTGAGLRGKQGTLRYDELQDALDRETGGIEASYDLAPQFKRYELSVTASGVDEAEVRRTLTWLERCLAESDLSIDNLARLRSLTDQLAGGIRTQLGGAEERWVHSPSGALRYQRDHLYLSASSLHTKLHHLWRLSWRLAAWPEESEAAKTVSKLLELLRKQAADPQAAPADDIDRLLATVDGDAPHRGLLESIVQSLAAMTTDLPTDAPATERVALVEQLDADLRTPPAETLRALKKLYRRLLAPAHMRLVLTGRPGTLDALEPALVEMLDRRRVAVARSTPTGAGEEPPQRLTLADPVVLDRVRARTPETPEPLTHFGLVNEKSGQGVFVHSVEAAGLDDLDRDQLISELAAAVYSGAGPHAFFMNTWSAGLAYSNGASVSPSRMRASYYAERCPDLVQTMRFVVDLARGSEELGEEMTEYAIARLVTATRASDRFEARARAQAADLEDGITPERVTAYRKAILALRDDEHLWEDMRARIQTMTGRTLVGLGARSREQPGGNFLTIGPERLLAEYEHYVQEVEADYEEVHRIYPADFWIRE